MLATDRPETMSMPRLPVATLEKKRHSRMCSGWSSPMSLIMRFEYSGVACGPSRIAAGSPGTRLLSVNSSSMAPKMISAVVTRRLPR